MKSRLITAFLFVAMIMMAGNAIGRPDPPKDGKSIFMSRCASCHNVNKDMTGPALAGVDQRRSINWIINFVQSSQAMVKKGDKDAVAVFEKFNKVPMPDHADLNDEDIRNVVEYIKSDVKPTAESKAAFARPAVKKANFRPVSFTRDFWPLMGVLGATFLLVATLLFAVKVNNMKKEFDRKKHAAS